MTYRDKEFEKNVWRTSKGNCVVNANFARKLFHRLKQIEKGLGTSIHAPDKLLEYVKISQDWNLEPTDAQERKHLSIELDMQDPL